MITLEQIQEVVKIKPGMPIYKQPGFIVGPISILLGIVINFIFNIIYGVAPANSLGFTIILFTIFTRIIMLPLVAKQMKSMRKMQEIVPLTNEIKEKYKGKTDQESKQKETMEIQKLYQENGINPFAGCLPMLIQMPIFFALNQVIRNAYLYIDKINVVYSGISEKVMEIPDYINTISPIIYDKLPKGVSLDVAVVEDLNQAINVFSANDWYAILANAPTELSNEIYSLLVDKNVIDTFFGMNLSENPTLFSVTVIFPILAAVTTFFSSYLSMKGSGSLNGDGQQAQQQKMMLYMMPIMMGVMSFGLTAGVGLYWITSSLFQIGQQLIMNKKPSTVVASNDTKKANKNKK